MKKSHDALLKENAVFRSELDILECIRSSKLMLLLPRIKSNPILLGMLIQSALSLGRPYTCMLRDFDNNTFDNAKVKGINRI